MNTTTVKRAIDLVGRPVLLVGHSYGGFVIMLTCCLYNNPAVKGLVYLAAFAPKEGQSLGNFLGTPAKGFVIVDSGGFIYINPTIFGPAVAQDVDPAQVKSVCLLHKSHIINLFLLKNLVHQHGNNFLLGIKSLRTTTLSLQAAEHMFAKQINATTISLPSSHASPLSHPNEVAQFILGAANNLTRGVGK